MDLEAVRIFLKVSQLASFTRAGEQLGIPKARVSLRLKALEEDLGTSLLQRTTTAVKLTPDGEQFLLRAKHLLSEADELEAMFQSKSTLRGRVRVDAPVKLSRDVLIPRLPELLAAHPQLELSLSTTDRRVELIREGFDCVLRVGALPDSGLVTRKLGELAMINCASPAYLNKYGAPRTLADLARHLVVHYSLTLGADAPSFEYRDAAGTHEIPMRAAVTVNSTDAYLAACLAGLGIIQSPRLGMRDSLAAGALVEVLPEYTCAPMPVTLVHGHAGNVPKRVRVVMQWIAHVLEPHLAAAARAA